MIKILLLIPFLFSCSLLKSKETKEDVRSVKVKEYIRKQRCLRDKRFCSQKELRDLNKDEWSYLALPRKKVN